MTFEPPTREDLLQVWRGGLPPDYRTGIEFRDDGRGFDIVVGQAAIFERVAEADAVTTQVCYLRPHSTQVRPQALGQLQAVGSVSIARAAPADAPITLVVGTRLVVQVHDESGALIDASTYETTSEGTFAAGDLGPLTLPIRALRYGYQGNVPLGRPIAFVERGRYSVPGTVTAANTVADTVGVADRIVPDLVGRYVRFTGLPNAPTTPRMITAVSIAMNQATTANTITVDGPALTLGAQTFEIDELADLGLTVELATALTTGRHGWLDAWGEERLCYRQSLEDDASYLARILAVDDVVSPGALVRAATRILTPIGIPFAFREAGEAFTFSGYLWYPDLYLTGSIGSVPITVNFASKVRYFAIIVPLSSTGNEGTYLDTFQGATDTNYLDGEAYLDSFPFEWNRNMQALFNEMIATKEGGVAFQILIDPLS
jgi:hypothetical protein